MSDTDLISVIRETNAALSSPLDRTVACFQRWLHLPEPGALLVTLAAVAANRLDGDPVWLLLVAPPGGGKTEILGSVLQLDEAHEAATLTEASLLSGTPQKDKATDARGGLLKEIGELGLIVAKDFGSVLSMNRDARSMVLAALREVYDGRWTRHVGTDGGRTLHWEGKVGLIAGCTPTIDRHHAVIGAMGERFVMYRLPVVDEEVQAFAALQHAENATKMRVELAGAVKDLFSRGLKQPLPRSKDDNDRLVTLARLAVRARSAVERDGYSREIELVPQSEAPTRLVVVLARLLAGLDAIGATRETGWQVVTKAALDSIPALRLSALRDLHERDEPVETATVATELGYPTTTMKRALEDLAAHGLAERVKQGKGKADMWAISSLARGLLGEQTRNVLKSFGKEEKSLNRPSDISGLAAEDSSPDISGEAQSQPATLFDDAEPEEKAA